MNFAHLKIWFRSKLRSATLETLEEGATFQVEVLAGKPFKLRFTPESTGHGRNLGERALEGYVQQYKNLGGSLRPGDYYGHNSSYIVAIFAAFNDHRAKCACFKHVREVTNNG